MRLESRLSLQQEVGWDRETVRMARYLADSQSSPFIVSSPSTIRAQLTVWRETFPDIQPTYNVGANPCVEVLQNMQDLSLPFLFSNKQQLASLMELGVQPTQATFASSTKLTSHLRAAQGWEVESIYCDSVQELTKIKKCHPTARIIIQLSCDTSYQQSGHLGSESGAQLTELTGIFNEADKLGVTISGLALALSVSPEPTDHLARVQAAATTARQALDLAAGLGRQLTSLHLGEIWPISLASSTSFPGQVMEVLQQTGLLVTGLNITADSSEFLVSGSITLAAQIIGVRKEKSVMVYNINEGVFGAFADNLTVTGDPPVTAPLPLGGGRNRKGLTAKLLETNLVGPTGDELDNIVEDIVLQRMEIGDWLLFPNMGTKQLVEFQAGGKMRGSQTLISIKGGGGLGRSGARPCPPEAWDILASPGKIVQLDLECDLRESSVSQGLRGEVVELGETFIYDEM